MTGGSGSGTGPEGSDAADTRSPATVTLLTQADCGLCEHAKTVLDRVQRDATTPVKISVVEIDLSSDDGRRLAGDAGVLFAPGVLLNGRPFAHGRLSERKLRRALQLE